MTTKKPATNQEILDWLLNHWSLKVRQATSELMDLDKLVEHEDDYIRSVVASRGYGLEILMKDEIADVRGAVAMNTNDIEQLKILALDKAVCVRGEAYLRFVELNK